MRPITDRQNRIKSDHLSKSLSQYIYDEHAAIQVMASLTSMNFKKETGLFDSHHHLFSDVRKAKTRFTHFKS